MILYILFCIVSLRLVEIEMSATKQAATISRNFGQKLTMNQEYSKILKDGDKCEFNKMPTSSVLNNEQEFITLQPVSTSTSSYPPPPSTPYSPTKQQPFPFMSTFFGPIGGSKIKHILTKVRRIPGASIETLAFVNIMDQDYYGIGIVDDLSFIKVVFQRHLNPKFKTQIVTMLKSGKFFKKITFLLISVKLFLIFLIP